MSLSEITPGYSLAACLVLSLGLMSGCSSSSSSSDNGDNGTEGLSGDGVRVVNAAPGIDNVDLYIDGDQVNENSFWYGRALGHFSPDESAGSTEVRFVEPGGDPQSDVIVHENVSVSEGGNKTVVLYETQQGPELYTIDDSASGGARVRVSHFIDGVDAIDIYLHQGDEAADPLAQLSAAGENIAFGETIEWETLDGMESDTRLRITEHGEDEVIFHSGQPGLDNPLRLNTGDQVHVVLVHADPELPVFGNQRNFSELAGVGLVNDEIDIGRDELMYDQRAQLQIINAVHDVNSIDVTIDNEASVEGIAYQEGSGLLEVTPVPTIDAIGGGSPRQFTVTDSNTDEVLLQGGRSLDAGEHRVFVLAGSYAEDFIVMPDESSGLIPPSEGRAGFWAAPVLHAYEPDGGFIDLVVNDSLAFGLYMIEPMSVDSDLLASFDNGNTVDVAFYDTHGNAGNCCNPRNLIASETFTDLDLEVYYTFVLAGNYTGDPEADSDIFYVESPWRFLEE